MYHPDAKTYFGGITNDNNNDHKSEIVMTDDARTNWWVVGWR